MIESLVEFDGSGMRIEEGKNRNRLLTGDGWSHVFCSFPSK